MTFTATIRSAGNGGHAVVVPPAEVDGFSSSRPAVTARIRGATFDGRLARYGGKTYLGIRQAFLREIGAAAGDSVEVELQEQVVEPAPEPPPPAMTPELDAALTGDLRTAWDGLGDEPRTEYLRWVAAVDGDQRAERVARTVRRLGRLTG